MSWTIQGELHGRYVRKMGFNRMSSVSQSENNIFEIKKISLSNNAKVPVSIV